MANVVRPVCFTPKCKKTVSFECHCASPCLFSCTDHLKQHRFIPGDHNIHYTQKIVLDGNKKVKNLAKINDILKNLKNLKEITMKDCSQVIEGLNKAYIGLITKIKEVKLNISTIKTRIISNKSVNVDELTAVVQIIVNPKTTINEEIISNISKNLKIEEFLSQISNDCIFFAKKNDPNLFTINLQTLKCNAVPNINNYWMYAAACKLSNTKFFISGGSLNDTSSESASIVNIKSSSVKFLPSSTPKRFHSCVFKDNEIFVFGGHDKTILNSAHKFSLEMNMWSSIASLPTAAVTWSTVINEKILIVGFQFDCAYVFQNNNYTGNLSLARGYYRCCEKWIISNKKLIECCDLDRILWQEYNINEINLGWSPLNITLKRGKSIFFVNKGYELWKIDTEIKIAEMLNYI